MRKTSSSKIFISLVLVILFIATCCCTVSIIPEVVPPVVDNHCGVNEEENVERTVESLVMNATSTQVQRRILVTGAAGFIGYHLSSLLKTEFNDLVIGLDNFNDYYDVQLKHMRANLLRNINVTVVKGDVCDKELVDELFDKYSFTHVVHLAAQAGVRYSLDNPKAYVTANIMCHVNLLEAIKTHDSTVPFIYASSSSVYGLNTKIPFSEEDTVTRPSNVYGATKIAGEHLSNVYNHLYNIPVIGLRFFTVYGPLGRPDMAVYKWTDKIAANSPIPLFYKTGVVIRRDFTHVSDIVRGIEGTLRLDTFKLNNNAPQVFNLGNHHPESVDDLVSYLASEMKRDVKKTMIELPETDMVTTYANIDKAAKLLNFKPKTLLKEGVSNFVQWYRDTYWPEEVIFTTYFTGKKDPERDIQIQHDNFEKMREWYESVHAANLHAVIFHDSLHEDFVNRYTTPNVRFERVTLGVRSTNDERFFIYRKYLIDRMELNRAWAPTRVLMTDLFDVKFNKSPFEFMRKYEVTHNVTDTLYIGSEETTIADNEWSQTRLSQCAAEETWSFLMNEQLLNPGIVGGQVSAIVDFLKHYNQFMHAAPVKANCNTPMFNIIVRQSYNSKYVTGAPFHTEFRKEDLSTEFYVKHK